MNYEVAALNFWSYDTDLMINIIFKTKTLYLMINNPQFITVFKGDGGARSVLLHIIY